MFHFLNSKFLEDRSGSDLTLIPLQLFQNSSNNCLDLKLAVFQDKVVHIYWFQAK